MSKKSRKRNKKILAAIGIGLGAAALASKKKAALGSTEDGKGGIDTIAKAKQSMTSDKAYSSPKKTTTIQDNKPKVFKPNKSAADDIMRGGKGTKYVDKYAGTPLRRLQKNSVGPSMSGIDDMNDFAAKDGGRARHKSGGSVKKSMGKALRGGGKVIR